MPGSEFEPRSPLQTRRKRHIACDEFFAKNAARSFYCSSFSPRNRSAGFRREPCMHLLRQMRFLFCRGNSLPPPKSGEFSEKLYFFAEVLRRTPADTGVLFCPETVLFLQKSIAPSKNRAYNQTDTPAHRAIGGIYFDSLADYSIFIAARDKKGGKYRFGLRCGSVETCRKSFWSTALQRRGDEDGGSVIKAGKVWQSSF